LLNGVKQFSNLKQHQFTDDNCCCCCFYLGEYPEAVVIVLYVLGERLEDIGLENSKSALDQLVNRAPKTAFVKLENKNIPVNKVTVGTIIQVKPGEMIPLDGKIISGETTVDEAAITGEPIPKDKRPWCFICRNTQQNGFIEMETTTLHRYHLC
jgi:Cd2+/Zn2+-exporting ATPase